MVRRHTILKGDIVNQAGVPLKYEDVTAAWLGQALCGRWPGTKVSTVRRGPVFGYKKNKFRVEVEYAESPGALPSTFIVKGNFPAENDPSTGSAWAMATEVRSIRDVVPLIRAPHMPQWQFIGVDPDASAIVMEDLAPRGAVFFNAFTTLELGQARAFVDAFARMHASAWNSPTFQTGGAMGPGTFASENRRIINEVYFPTFFRPESWRSYVELPRGRALPNQFQDLARAEKAWHKMWEVLERSAMVVVHGDEHLGNLYVTADGTPGVIDWVARPERWPIGVAYFLVCSLDIADRRRWERELVARYVAKLTEHGAAGVPSGDEAWFMYRCASFFPVVTWLNNSGVWQPEAINTANAVRAGTAALDHDVYALLGP
jgi:aminoglycoside/choline kinase family phosphotransferase